MYLIAEENKFAGISVFLSPGNKSEQTEDNRTVLMSGQHHDQKPVDVNIIITFPVKYRVIVS